MESSLSFPTSLKRPKLITGELSPLVSSLNIPKTVDRGWAWIVLFASSFCHMIFTGQNAAIGVFYIEMRDQMEASITEVSITGALRTGSMYLLVAFTGPLSDLVGFRRMTLIGAVLGLVGHLVCFLWHNLYGFYIFFGVIQGISTAMTYAASVMVINDYFQKRRSFALSISLVADGFGVLFFGPFTSYLLDTYGLYGTILIHGALSLNIIVGAMLYFPQTNARNTVSVHKTMAKGIQTLFKSYKDKRIWKNMSFYLMMTSSFFCGLGLYIPWTLLPEFMVSRNISRDIASLSITAIGAGIIIGRFSGGIISDNFPRWDKQVYIWSSILASVCLYPVLLLDSTVPYLFVGVVFGLFYGCLSCMMPILLVHLFGSDRLSVSFGVNSLTYGIGALIGVPIAGVFIDTVPIIGIEYIYAGVWFTLCGLLVFRAFPIKEESKNSQQYFRAIS